MGHLHGKTIVRMGRKSGHNNRTPEKQGAWDRRSKEVLELILDGGEFKPDESLTWRN